MIWPLKEGQKSQGMGQPGLTSRVQPGSQDQKAPQSKDHRRDCSKQLSKECQWHTQCAWAEINQEDGRTYPNRNSERDRKRRSDQGTKDGRGNTVLVMHHVKCLIGEKTEPKGLKRWQ